MNLLHIRDKVLKLLVEMLSSQPKEIVVSSLRLTRALMLKYEWRVSFATEGGIKAILSCMQEHPTITQVQQVALAVSLTFNQNLKFLLNFRMFLFLER